MPDPVRWRLIVEYDGANFVGWARQPNGPSIQDALERAVQALVGHPVQVSGSGRTDAGVHALAQVASFETIVGRSAKSVVAGTNKTLPRGISVVSAEQVPLAFDPRRWAHGKRYRYRYLDRLGRSPLRDGQVWYIQGSLDVRAMHAGAQHLLGLHDFTSFRAAGCGARHAMRDIRAIRVLREGDEAVLHVEGNGFLRHMVRNIAGTLVDVGLGRKSPEWVGQVLAMNDRHAAGRTAPAHGLVLVEVRYGDGPPPWDSAETP